MIKLKDLLLEKVKTKDIMTITMLGNNFKNKFRNAVLKKQDGKMFKLIIKTIEGVEKVLKKKVYPGLDDYDGPQFKLNYKISFENAFDEVRNMLKFLEKEWSQDKDKDYKDKLKKQNKWKIQVMNYWMKTSGSKYSPPVHSRIIRKKIWKKCWWYKESQK